MTAGTIITVTLNAAIDRIIEVEGLTLGAHQVGREVLRVAAGKGFNVSRALAAMGVSSTASGFLGAENRAIFDAELSARGIGDQFITLPGHTRENITITDPRSGQDTHIRDVGLAVNAAAMGQLARRLTQLAKPGNVIIFSGSLPPGISADSFAALVESCISGGARVAVDTNGPALSAVAGKRLWLVKPNVEELSQLVGRELADDRARLQAAKSLADRISNVILTAGSQGAYLFAGGLMLHGVSEVDGQVVRNTVGCGDVMLAAYVASLWRGDEVRTAFIHAIACASAAAASANPAGFDPVSAQTPRPKVRLTNLAL
ncbi:MAG: hexose kinase [Phycisphaerae bacterium]|jgi:1-phosphofructokinase family hexose kinase